MKWVLAGLLVAMLRPAPADACGIHLVLKTPNVRPATRMTRSSNPSHLLLLGVSPHRLERELKDAGHDVEIEAEAASARRIDYRVVVVDARDVAATSKLFPRAIIIGRSGDVSSDIVAVEQSLARPLVATGKQKPIHADVFVPPIRTGGGHPTTPLNSGGGGGAITPPNPPPPPIVTTPPPPPAVPAPRDEVYFGYASTKVAGKAALDREAKWLLDHSTAHVIVEGYADPTGTHEANMAIGQARAEAVRDYLVGAGVASERIEIMSYGDTQLKYGKADVRNRRVAIEPKP
jgi:peptidoglycan-associated lipoprotein